MLLNLWYCTISTISSAHETCNTMNLPTGCRHRRSQVSQSSFESNRRHKGGRGNRLFQRCPCSAKHVIRTSHWGNWTWGGYRNKGTRIRRIHCRRSKGNSTRYGFGYAFAVHLITVFLDPLTIIRRRRGARNHGLDSSSSPSKKSSSSHVIRELSIKTNRKNKFVDCLLAEEVNLGDGCRPVRRIPGWHDVAELKKLAWNGIPAELRPVAWQLLLVSKQVFSHRKVNGPQEVICYQGYLPLPAHLRTSALARKRDEYASLVKVTFARGREGLDQQIWHSIVKCGVSKCSTPSLTKIRK